MIRTVYPTTKVLSVDSARRGDVYFTRTGIVPAFLSPCWDITRLATNEIAQLGGQAVPISRNAGTTRDLNGLLERSIFIVYTAGDAEHSSLCCTAADPHPVLLSRPVKPEEGLIVRSGCFLVGTGGVAVKGFILPDVRMASYMRTVPKMAHFYGCGKIAAAFKGDVCSFRLMPGESCRINPAQLVMLTDGVTIEKLSFLTPDMTLGQLLSQRGALLTLQAGPEGGEVFLSAEVYNSEKDEPE